MTNRKFPRNFSDKIFPRDGFNIKRLPERHFETQKLAMADEIEVAVINCSSLEDMVAHINQIRNMPRIPKEDIVPMPEREDGEEDGDDKEPEDNKPAKRDREESFKFTDYQKGCIDEFIIEVVLDDDKDKAKALEKFESICSKLGIHGTVYRQVFKEIVCTVVTISMITQKTEFMGMEIYDALEIRLSEPKFKSLMEAIKNSDNPDKDSAKCAIFAFPTPIRRALYGTIDVMVVATQVKVANSKTAMAMKEMMNVALDTTKLSRYAKYYLASLLTDMILEDDPKAWSHEYIETVIGKVETKLGGSRYTTLRSAILSC